MSLPAGARIGSTVLAVADLDRSARFYRDVLGFDVVQEAGVARLSAAGGPTLVELRERPGAQPRPRRSAGLFHIAILVPSRATLGRSLRRLAAARWPLTGAADHLVSEALYLDDPDGLGLEIYRDRPRDEWPTRDGALVMATDPLDLDSVVREPGADAEWLGLAAGTVIGHVHLRVADLSAAEAFYCGRVGFSPTVRDYPGALFVAAGGYHHHLGLNTWAGRGVPPPPAEAAGLVSFIVQGAGETRRVVDEATGVAVELAA